MITTLIVMAALAIVCFGLLDPLTLRQQSVLFAGALYGYLFIRHRGRVQVAPAPKQARQPQPAAQPAPTFVPPKPPAPAGQPKAQRPAPAIVTGKLNFYQEEAAVINRQLRQIHKLNCGIDLKPGTIKITPDFVIYSLRQTGPLRFDDLRRIEDDLAREINDLHRNHRAGEVSVLAVNSQPMVLQVSRQRPQKLLWADRKWQGRPLQTTLGRYWHGVAEHEMVLDLAGNASEYINGAFFGQPGAGKSTALHIALIGLLESTPPEQLEVYAIDLKANAYAAYQDVPHVRQVAGAIDEAIDILETFATWCTADGRPEDGKHRLLLVDECQMLLTHSEHGDDALGLLGRILEAGREAGIRVWTATQNPDAQSYPSKLKPRTHWMAAAAIRNDDYIRRQLKIYGAAKLRGKGELIFVGPYGDYRLTTFWLTDEDRAAAIDGLVRKWGRRRTGYGGGYDVDMTGYTVDMEVDTSGYDVDISTGYDRLPEGTKPIFPIRSARALTPQERAAVRDLAKLERFRFRGGLSKRRLVPFIYGSRDPQREAWVNEALEEGSDDEGV